MSRMVQESESFRARSITRIVLTDVRRFGLTSVVARVLRKALLYRVGQQRASFVVDGQLACTLVNGRRLVLNPSDRGLSVDLILGEGVREPLATRYILDNVPRGGRFLDLGANIGYYTVLLGGHFEETVALEPVRESFLVLEKNIELNALSGSVVALNAAVTPDGGDVRVLQHSKRNLSRVTHDRAGEGASVPSFSLSQLAEHYGEFDFLKMDIEGYEYELLVGAGDWLRLSGPSWLFYEHHFGTMSPSESVELLRVLTGAGYELRAAFREATECIGADARMRRWIDRLDYVANGGRGRVLAGLSLSQIMTDQSILEGRLGCLELILAKL